MNDDHRIGWICPVCHRVNNPNNGLCAGSCKYPDAAERTEPAVEGRSLDEAYKMVSQAQAQHGLAQVEMKQPYKDANLVHGDEPYQKYPPYDAPHKR